MHRLTKLRQICLCVKICQVMAKNQVRNLQLKLSTIQARLNYQPLQTPDCQSLGAFIWCQSEYFELFKTTIVLTSTSRSSFRAKSPISERYRQKLTVKVKTFVTGFIPMTIHQAFGHRPRDKSVKLT